MKQLANHALSWLYPRTCAACKVIMPLNPSEESIDILCMRCESLFDPIPLPTCPICGNQVEEEVERCSSCYGKTFYFESNHAAFLYEDLLKDLFHDMKFRGKKRVAEALGKLWASQLKIAPHIFPKELHEKKIIFIPLPLHPQKRRERGFNQAELMAVELSNSFDGTAVLPILKRLFDTPPQSGLHPKQREENVSGIFGIAPDYSPEPEAVYIVVDDIYTTGASLNECCKTLRAWGAQRVMTMTLAVPVKKPDEAEKNS